MTATEKQTIVVDPKAVAAATQAAEAYHEKFARYAWAFAGLDHRAHDKHNTVWLAAEYAAEQAASEFTLYPTIDGLVVTYLNLDVEPGSKGEEGYLRYEAGVAAVLAWTGKSATVILEGAAYQNGRVVTANVVPFHGTVDVGWLVKKFKYLTKEDWI